MHFESFNGPFALWIYVLKQVINLSLVAAKEAWAGLAKGPHKLFLVCQYSTHEDIELLRGMLITYWCMFVMHGLTCAQLYEISFSFTLNISLLN